MNADLKHLVRDTVDHPPHSRPVRHALRGRLSGFRHVVAGRHLPIFNQSKEFRLMNTISRGPRAQSVLEEAPRKTRSARPTTAIDDVASVRAENLARRIEQGASEMARFAETLSDDEWNAPMPGVSSDRRPLGVIVHHVASMYPIEIDVARAVAAGVPVTDVTWHAVAEINGKHAADHRGPGRAETMALLAQNSSEAAEAVRGFSDDMLDRAVPFSLSFGAPMTAQFVIEDHALRHSWHHMARMRRALGR